MKITRINGVFPAYKPLGITSAQFLEILKKRLKDEGVLKSEIKMGHGGTLDKAASGILVVGINKGTKKLPAFLNGHKIYKTSCLFGRATDTYNSEGKVTTEKPYGHLTKDMIEEALTKFHGTKLQKPPMYSALKQNGRRLSDLARDGIYVNPELRLVQCYSTMISEYQAPQLTFGVVCGAGFYVRSLVHDLGLMLNSCAHVVSLERTRQGPFTTQHCLYEDQFTSNVLWDRINQLRHLTEEYLNENMAGFRKKSSQWEYSKKSS